jgi:hypothetical protein
VALLECRYCIKSIPWNRIGVREGMQSSERKPSMQLGFDVLEVSAFFGKRFGLTRKTKL